MGKWSYTYVPSKDVNVEHLELRRAQIDQLDRQQAITYLRLLSTEVNDTAHRFRQLLAKPVYQEMLAKGSYWKDAILHGAPDTIEQLSKMNLQAVTKAIQGIPLKYKPLMDRLENLPYTLKHNTRKQYVAEITKSRCILSLTELHRRDLGKTIQGGTTHEGLDDKKIHNEDFVFFRLSLGLTPAHSRFGSECFVFSPVQFFKFGWVSLHDMLSTCSTERMCSFPPISNLKELESIKKNPFAKPIRMTSSDETMITHNYPKTGTKITQHKVQEVFYGEDIRVGIAYSVVKELYSMLGVHGLDMALAACGPGPDNDKLLLNLICNLFFLEAKVPTLFHYTPQELLQFHKDVAYDHSNKG